MIASAAAAISAMIAAKMSQREQHRAILTYPILEPGALTYAPVTASTTLGPCQGCGSSDYVRRPHGWTCTYCRGLA